MMSRATQTPKAGRVFETPVLNKYDFWVTFSLQIDTEMEKEPVQQNYNLELVNP